MMCKDITVLVRRFGLIVAAFAMIAAIIAQPLWERLWPAHLTVSESRLSRIQ